MKKYGVNPNVNNNTGSIHPYETLSQAHSESRSIDRQSRSTRISTARTPLGSAAFASMLVEAVECRRVSSCLHFEPSKNSVLQPSRIGPRS